MTNYEYLCQSFTIPNHSKYRFMADGRVYKILEVSSTGVKTKLLAPNSNNRVWMVDDDGRGYPHSITRSIFFWLRDTEYFEENFAPVPFTEEQYWFHDRELRSRLSILRPANLYNNNITIMMHNKWVCINVIKLYLGIMRYPNIIGELSNYRMRSTYLKKSQMATTPLKEISLEKMFLIHHKIVLGINIVNRTVGYKMKDGVKTHYNLITGEEIVMGE